MATVLIILLLLLVVFFAARSSFKHLKGEGSCCGGGGESFAEPHKELDGPVMGTWYVTVEGMHCENCKNSIERAVNRLEGASCQVDLKSKLAKVDYDRPLDPEALRRAIEWLDYSVRDMREEKRSG